MAKAKKIRVLIADGRPVFRSGLRVLLSQEPDISVVGEAESGQQTLKRVAQLSPRVLIMDSFGGVDGADVVQQLQRKHSDTRVILLSSSDKEDESLKAMRPATAGIVTMHAPFSLLLQCIRKAEAGEPWSDGSPIASAAKDFSGLFSRGGKSSQALVLSARERQVVELVSQGFKNKEIAQRMFISEQTVKNHLHNIFDKLGVSDRLELALYAIHKNLQPVE
jgi:DNA-binding NarL/FixJ family response regulator